MTATSNAAAATAEIPAPAPAAGAVWLVCHTKPRCEKKFSALMTAERFEHYLPLVPSVRKYRQQTKRFTKPLFPGYVFARVPAELRARIYQQDLLARAIVVEDVPRFLHQLDDVKLIVASGYELTVLPLLTRGRRVKVVGGPLHGLEGHVDDPSNPRGVVLSVDVLQQGLLVKLPAENLQVLP
ncbi:MAG TPA: transcription termination/antitermination NusG family protein [Opitutus sp.]|nr:transcription termination/antitermination NusG family protein [Opitutus sp.]